MKDRTAVHKRALEVYDRAMRLCRADATEAAVSIVHDAARALREAQYVCHGPDYTQEVARATALIDGVHDAVIRIEGIRKWEGS